MAEYVAVNAQTLQPGDAIVFTDSDPCVRGLVRHRNQTGTFLLAGAVSPARCNCGRNHSVDYFVDFHANVAVPTGGTVGEVQLAIAVEGTAIPSSVMRATPAAVEEFFNVGRSTNVPIWANCCQTVSIINSGTIPVTVQEANIVINYEG